MTDTTELNKKESTITAYILKGGSTASATDRDAGFCSGGDEDDLEIEDDIHSPTDVSEDSVEVKVTPISSRNKNKRKCAEPRKVPNDEIVPSGPLKKRIRFEMKQEETATERKKSFFEAMKKETVIVKQETNYFTETKLERNFDPAKQSEFYQLKHQSPNSDIKHERSPTGRSSPFRPWSLPTRPVSSEPSPPPGNFHPVYGYQSIPVIQQDEPLSLVKTKPESPRQYEPQQHQQRRTHEDLTTNPVPDAMIIRPKEFAKIPIKIEPPRVPPHPAVRPPTAQEIEELTRPPKASPGFTVESLLSAKASTSSSQHAPSCSSVKGDKTDSKKEHKDQKEQRNYKNMTRERRIEANARERTRVHTISAAFDTLRKSIPAYSHNQKLSKLSVLRIACSYILTLSRVAGSDYSADQSEPSLADCVDLVSRTIQTEGKIRKKKDE